MIWKQTKRTNYGLKLSVQDLWGKYARKINNQGINKMEYRLRDHDDLLHRFHASDIFRLYNQKRRKREGVPHKIKEQKKARRFRTRKLLKVYYENLKYHNIKIHMKKAGVKNGLGYTINFYKLLERRLDVMCLRVFFYKTLREAKQYIRNGFVTINGKIMKSINYILKDSDILSIRGDVRLEYKKKYLHELKEGQILRSLPPYLKMNLRTFEIKFVKEFFNFYKIPHLAKFPIGRFPNLRKTP